MYDVGDEIFGIVGRLGVEKDWYGAELEGTIGVIDEDIGGIDVGVDHSLAAFAVGRLPVGNRLKALGRVGYHTTQVGAMDNNGDSASADFDGIAYGAGVEYDLNPVSGLRLDYTRYDLEEATSDSLAATYIRRF
jgi:opacity protein-like surface antigen